MIWRERFAICFAAGKNIEMQVFQDALKQYVKRKDKNLRMLMKYAAMFHVEKILRPYLEVLL